jgi:2-keto-4-pentenoate hydratase/2-oxohepta-3-ene-1,7-dioic acid hydratase in catechol pathway
VKLGFFNNYIPCVVKNDGVVDISAEIGNCAGFSPQAVLEKIINDWAALKPKFEKAAAGGKVVPFAQAKLRAPVPRPGKVLCGERNFMEGVPLDPPGALGCFFKSPDAVIGPGEDIVLPKFRPVIFNHEAELGIVIGKTAKEISEKDALGYVFGYCTAVDVSARGPEEGEAALPGGRFGKCFDTFLPIGPYITTADEVKDPNKLQVKYWVNGQLRQDYNMSDMEHGVDFMVATLSHCMSLKPGDLILAGTNHSHLGPLQDGDKTEMEIEGLGRTDNPVKDSLKRKFPVKLRDPKVNQDRRRNMQGKPNEGTWPFKAVGGQPKK